LRKGRKIVLLEVVLDLAASEGAATHNLEGETGSGEGKGCQGTRQGRSFGLDRRGRGIATRIAIGYHRDFGSSTVGRSAGDRAGEI